MDGKKKTVSNKGAFGEIPNPIYDWSEGPKFEFKSKDFNLKYKKFIPFIGAYLFYRYVWKTI